jgi:hypothetical protein
MLLPIACSRGMPETTRIQDRMNSMSQLETMKDLKIWRADRVASNHRHRNANWHSEIDTRILYLLWRAFVQVLTRR